MRRMILTSLVLVPVLAHAQASLSTALMPSPIPANLAAELTRYTGSVVVTLAAANSAAAASSVANGVTNNFADSSMRKGRSLVHGFGGLPTDATAPILTRAVEVEMSEKEMAGQPARSSVAIRATIDANGTPRDLTVVRSAGSLLDQRAIAAVSQYRFVPAMLDKEPVDAAVTITIKIQKP